MRSFPDRSFENQIDAPAPPSAPICAQCKQPMRLERIEAMIADHEAVTMFRCEHCRLSEAIPLT
jgi:hypothetical protein